MRGPPGRERGRRRARACPEPIDSLNISYATPQAGSAITFTCAVATRALTVQLGGSDRTEHYYGGLSTCSQTVSWPGSVSSTPPGIDCDRSVARACTRAFLQGSSVTLTASDQFASWSGACAGTLVATCTVSMTEARTVQAFFTAA